MDEDRATRLQTWGLRIALVLPAIAILFAALPRLMDGIALEAAYPVSDYIPANVGEPERDYRIAQLALAATPDADGDAHLLGVEAGSLVGEPPAILIPQSEAGLASSPANARGWIILAELLSPTEPAKAASALALAFELAPHEYYQMGPRTLVAAPLWQRLPTRDQSQLFADVRALSTDRDFRPVLMSLLQRKGGGALIERAFAGRPAELRDLNRSIIATQLGLSP